jgi:hypothetical protein
MPNDAARRTETEIPPGRQNSQAIRSPEYRETHWNLRTETADYDCDGAGRGRIAADVLKEKCSGNGSETDDEHVQGYCSW